MLCVLFSFFEVQKELNIIDSHSVPRPCFWWPSLAGSFLQSHRAGHSLLAPPSLLFYSKKTGTYCASEGPLWWEVK